MTYRLTYGVTINELPELDSLSDNDWLIASTGINPNALNKVQLSKLDPYLGNYLDTNLVNYEDYFLDLIALATATYTLTAYDNIVIADNPLLYFPLTKASNSNSIPNEYYQNWYSVSDFALNV